MRARAWGASALIYAAVTVIFGRHVLAQVGTTIANDVGDPLLTAAILHWNAHHMPWTDAWWQFPIFHPTRDALTFSEHLLGLGVIASPIAWISGNPLTTYNLTTLLTFPLCGMAMYALVQRLTGHAGAAFLAGLAYAFAPYRISNLPHVQMLASFWAPLALLGLHGFLEPAGHGSPSGVVAEPVSRTRRARLGWLVLFGAAWLLQAAANLYSLVFLTVLVALWVAWFVIAHRNWRALVMIAAAIGIAALPLAPLLYRYTTVHASHGFERSLDEVRIYSADVAAVLCAPPNLSIWGWIRVACRAEGELFPGVATFALCAAALWLALRRPATVVSAKAAGRPLLIVQRVLAAVAFVFGLIIVSVLIIGPWQVDAGFARISASEIDKPSLIALAAVLIALVVTLASLVRGPRAVIGFYLFAALVTWCLALGPTLTFMGELSGRPGPYALLLPLPGIGGLRVPARFWLMTVLCLSVVVGLLMAHVLRSLRGSMTRAAFMAVAVVIALDGWAAPIPAQQPPAAAPDPSALRDRVVLQLPMDPFPDIAATWRAVTGGWRAVNGYSGYAPRYYDALSLAARIGDDAMFLPFQRDHELDVLTRDNASDRAAVERQPGAVIVARGNGMVHYRLPRRPPPVVPPPGASLPIVAVRTDCGGEIVNRAFDGDQSTVWECLQDQNPTTSTLTIDLGEALPVGAVDYSQGGHSWVVPSGLQIETSLDGLEWTAVRNGSALRELIEGSLATPRSLRALLRFAPRTARYVRLRPISPSPENFAWFVAELRVLGS